MNKKVGFIGLGKMGLPMALNLCKKDFEVWVCSGNPESQKRLMQAGAKAVENYREMAVGCDIVITIIPADKEIIKLYTGDDGIIAHAREGLVCIDMTSAKGNTKRTIAEHIEHSGKKVQFIDAPVSGGVAGAEAGKLTIMVGADKTQYEENILVFQAMGEKIVHTGSVGSGSDIKMLNQLLNGANAAIAAEVLCISRTLGLDDKILSEVINQSSGGSFVFEKNVPKYMMTGDHTPGFRLNLMKKDVGLFIDTVREVNGFAPLANLVYQLYEATANQGGGDKNYTYIHKWMEQNQGEN